MDGRPKTQPEVHRLLGRCLILVQCYETLAKTMLAQYDIASDDADLSTAVVERQARLAGVTLGAMAGQMTDGVFVPIGQTDKADTATEARFALRVRLELPPDRLAQVAADLRDFVARRNRLVHHFLQDHDLASEPGCQRAVAALQDAHALMSAAFDNLKEWAMDMDVARAAMAAELASPAWQDASRPGASLWPIARLPMPCIQRQQPWALGNGRRSRRA